MFRVPRQSAIQTMNRLGLDGAVSYRLSSTPEFLVIDDRTGRRMIRWGEIGAAQTANGHFTLVESGRALFVPIRLDTENEPFVGLLSARVNGGALDLGRKTVERSLLVVACYAFLSLGQTLGSSLRTGRCFE